MGAQQRAVKAEILLSLIDPPPSVTLRQKLRTVCGNLGFLARSLPTAPAQAEALLLKAVEFHGYAKQGSFWNARIQVDLALLRARKAPPTEARQMLLHAGALADEQCANALKARIERAIARLDV